MTKPFHSSLSSHKNSRRCVRSFFALLCMIFLQLVPPPSPCLPNGHFISHFHFSNSQRKPYTTHLHNTVSLVWPTLHVVFHFQILTILVFISTEMLCLLHNPFTFSYIILKFFALCKIGKQ
jgi:hypothetical protein